MLVASRKIANSLIEWTQLFRQDDLLFLMYRWALDLFHCVDR
jgi:hypothetical protein